MASDMEISTESPTTISPLSIGDDTTTYYCSTIDRLNKLISDPSFASLHSHLDVIKKGINAMLSNFRAGAHPSASEEAKALTCSAYGILNQNRHLLAPFENPTPSNISECVNALLSTDLVRHFPASRPKRNQPDDDGFTIPSKYAKATDILQISQCPTIPISNQFATLPTPPSDLNEQPKEQPPRKSLRPEPFYIQMVENYREIIHDLFEHIGEKLIQKLVGDFIRITPTSIETYRSCQSYLQEKKIASFGMLPRGERPKKVLIRGLPRTTSIDEIKSALSFRGHSVLRAAQLRKYKTKEPMPLFMVTLQSKENFATIFQEEELLGFEIKVEAFRNSAARQCYRCQKFNHSSECCSLAPACVKCAGPHDAKQCSLTENEKEKIKCANCGDNHTANYRGCPKYPGNAKKLRPKTIKEVQFNQAPLKPVTSTFSNVLSSKSQNDTSPTPPTPSNTPPTQHPATTNPQVTNVLNSFGSDQIEATIQKLERIEQLLSRIYSLCTTMNIPPALLLPLDNSQLTISAISALQTTNPQPHHG